MGERLHHWICSLGILSLGIFAEATPILLPWPIYLPSSSGASSSNGASSTTSSTSARAPNNVTLSIGNRVNTEAGLDDYGTTIDGLTINLARWWGNSSLNPNGTEVQIVTNLNDTLTIRFGFRSNTTKNTAVDTTNVTKATGERKKRSALQIPSIPDIPSFPASLTVPSIPSVPIPRLNSSFISINDILIPLPDSLSNLSLTRQLDISDGSSDSSQQPWEFIRRIAERQLFPIESLDPLVELLSSQYNSTAKPAFDTSLSVLSDLQQFASSVVNTGLDFVDSQASQHIGNAIRAFNGLTRAGQSCAGEFPEDAGQRVARKATDCVRDRLNEVNDIVDQFRDVVSSTENVFGGWLRQLSACNASAFANGDRSEQETAQRRCYVQATAESVTKSLFDLPIRWANLAVRTNNAVNNFQPDVTLCVASVGTEIASISTDYSLRIGLCQIIP
ncbi:uncharacterized protein LOC131684898 [Topomyia yanbarensis]|uniref:uncharacterized protein LOC131684898 n=1 Tax=Topomyia yanbarensis TaxID=2498891 RepID=UPI00273A887D|nr:uncharacterized protein LOC131684898 [Topomyia yanbarensis]